MFTAACNPAGTVSLRPCRRATAAPCPVHRCARGDRHRTSGVRSMDAVALSELKAITLGARALEDAARKQAERAERLITLIEQEAANTGDAALKRQDGRL